jgi:hypothetical protein
MQTNVHIAIALWEQIALVVERRCVSKLASSLLITLIIALMLVKSSGHEMLGSTPSPFLAVQGM